MAGARWVFFDWNGKDVPAAIRALPVGRYAIEEVGSQHKLTKTEEEGLRRALESVRTGRTLPASEVHARLRALVRQAEAKSSKRRARSR